MEIVRPYQDLCNIYIAMITEAAHKKKFTHALTRIRNIVINNICVIDMHHARHTISQIISADSKLVKCYDRFHKTPFDAFLGERVAHLNESLSFMTNGSCEWQYCNAIKWFREDKDTIFICLRSAWPCTIEAIRDHSLLAPSIMLP